jgi:hypothetical protein
VDGTAPVTRNRYIKLTGPTKSVNRDLEAKAHALAGLKGYTTNLTGATAEFVIDAYHQLWRIEKSFRMSTPDLQARPVYHHKRESIEAHLSIVFAALAVNRWIEHQTGWSIKKFVRTARRYRTVQIRSARQTLTAADPQPDDLRDALAKINPPHSAHQFDRSRDRGSAQPRSAAQFHRRDRDRFLSRRRRYSGPAAEIQPRSCAAASASTAAGLLNTPTYFSSMPMMVGCMPRSRQ